MRILHITEAAEYGVLRHISLLAGELARRGHQCVALLFGNRIDEGVALPCQRIIHRQSGGRLVRLPDSIRVIRRTVAEFKPDVVHLHAFAAGVAGRLALRGCVYSPHCFSTHKSLPWLTRKTVSIAEKCLDRRTGAYAFVSGMEYAEAALHLKLNGSKLHTCLNGLPDEFAKGLFSREEGRARLEAICPGIFGARRIGLFPGRLYPQKNPGLVLDALERLGETAPRVVFCGDGPLLDSLRRRGCASAFFIGRVPELWRCLKAFDFAVMASHYEGLSYAFMECLAAGLPMVATEAAGINEMLLVCKEKLPKGVLTVCPQDGVDSVARKICTVAEMPAYAPFLPLTLSAQVDSLLEVYGSLES